MRKGVVFRGSARVVAFDVLAIVRLHLGASFFPSFIPCFHALVRVIPTLLSGFCLCSQI